MHPNAAFRFADEGAMRAFAGEQGFAHLFCHTVEGPMVAHAPVVVADDGRLSFHIARGNRLTRHLDGARVIASIAGADAYVSPDWYGSADQVPTWNYVAVEAEGTARLLDRDGLVALLDALSAVHEAKLAPKRPWTREKMTPGRFEAMLPAILGFEIATPAWRGTSKLGQNKNAAERAGASAGLRAAGAVAIAELMDGL
ncbi:FMN-binding negative transcriptional regulator [Sphingomonas quercus]|uniref:FMN-binding negative transcriptional regulator n=1 Tax=Sphingomonas quercus TaxID=2842451 RepID=A0ABS6BI35_9SPHN|nr:FMN-binding negative transcriptional regulator [Sphingomonas quercus]MBU3077971.1 FMN-binding negative transcriptional regulator [Sphingomonas quercus]